MGSCTSADQAPAPNYATLTGPPVEGETKILRNPKSIASLESRPHPEVSTVFDALMHAFHNHPHNNMLGTREEDKYNWKIYSEIQQLARSFGSGLINLDLVPRETHEDMVLAFMGIYAKNREEWIIGDIACNMFNVCSVPLYDTLGAESMTYILEQTGMHTLLMSRENLQSFVELKSRDGTGQLRTVILMEEASSTERETFSKLGLRFFDMAEVIRVGSEKPQQYIKPAPTDLFTICYTSGTTGFPKGVMLTHSNVVAGIAGAIKFFRPLPSDVHISYLPLAHIYERVVLTTIMYMGARAGFYGGDILKLKEDLAILHPTILACVPRLLSRFYDVIQGNFASQSPSKVKLVQKALKSKIKNLQTSAKTTHGIWDKLIFKKVKKVLGGKVRIAVTASAPISGDTLNFLKVCFCCPILEAYGQTECAGACTCTVETDPETGHVGGPTTSCEIKLVDIPEMNYTSKDVNELGQSAPRGEICYRGPIIFKGYFKQPDITAETVDGEGWLHSGDVGLVTQNKSIKIIDRKKNIFKLAQGEYVAPEKVENIYIQSKYVALAFEHGDSYQSYAIGIFVPDQATCETWAKENSITMGWEELCNSRELKELILNDVTRLGTEAGLKGFEQVKKIHLHPEVLTPDSGLLTPTFKIKRHDARVFFKDVITHLYSS